MPEEKGEKYMRRAIELARRGEGWCHPNPLVGAVIVKNGRIIGEGWHEKYGELHAERNALRSCIENPEGAEMYVTLEPCCHYGKTPPCSEAIIKSGIKKLIVGSADPNPKVSGGGVRAVRNAGIEVRESFLKDECDELNRIFFHYISKDTPYIISKYAMSADGKISTVSGKSKWISGEKSREDVQKLRHRCMGIMTGIATVEADDPMLNCRLENGRNPVRIICDSSLKIRTDSRIVKSANEYETIIATAFEGLADGEITESSTEGKIKELIQKKVKIVNFCGKDKRTDLVKLMKYLHQSGIDSVLSEGGAQVNASLFREGLINEVQIYMAPKLIGADGKSPIGIIGTDTPDEAVKLKLLKIERIDEDIKIIYQVE